MFKFKLIKNNEDYQNAALQLDILLEKADLSQEERDEMELIAHLIEEYEESAYPIDLPSPIAAIKFRMEQMNLKQIDLVPYIGSKGRVSNILNGKRPLTLKMIRSLQTGLQIPVEALIQPDYIDYISPSENIDWNKFPVKAMFEQAREVFFSGVSADYNQIKDNSEYYLRKLLEPYKAIALGNALCRQNVRMSERSNYYALSAWIAGCCRLADEEKLRNNFNPENEEKIIEKLKLLSTFDSGPRMALEFLQKVGIHVVILSHLPRTYLDGAMFRARDGNPVIALTLRYDRIDYFWFTLFHELGHAFKHSISNDGNTCYLDDLSISARDEEEMNADLFASENLIKDEELEKEFLFTDYSTEKVTNFANRHYIHPAIVAGRIRYKKNNYRILTGLVGNGRVRNLFI